jgi:integrase
MTKKRGNGEGSVYQCKDGRFVGEYNDANGKRRYVSGKNKAEVRAKLREKLTERDKGIVVDAGGLTVGMYLDQWLESTRDTVSLRTYQRSEIAARVHIKPTLGKVKLDRLTAMQLDTLYRDKLKAGLSPRSVQIIHATVHKALKQAVRWRMVGMNVAEHATRPRSTGREIEILTKEQARHLLGTAKRTQPKLYALYALAVSTGARIGELLALQRGDVDLDAGTVRISKSVHEGRVTPPKTSSGRRTIMVHINKQQYFEGVSPGVWQFRVGGY